MLLDALGKEANANGDIWQLACIDTTDVIAWTPAGDLRRPSLACMTVEPDQICMFTRQS